MGSGRGFVQRIYEACTKYFLAFLDFLISSTHELHLGRDGGSSNVKLSFIQLCAGSTEGRWVSVPVE